MQECGITSALAMEILQSSTKPSNVVSTVLILLKQNAFSVNIIALWPTEWYILSQQNAFCYDRMLSALSELHLVWYIVCRIQKCSAWFRVVCVACVCVILELYTNDTWQYLSKVLMWTLCIPFRVENLRAINSKSQKRFWNDFQGLYPLELQKVSI